MIPTQLNFAVEPFTYVAAEDEEEEAGRRRQPARSAQRSRPQRRAAKGATRHPPARRRRPPRPRQRSTGVIREPAGVVAPVADSEQIRWLQSTLNQVLSLQLPVDGAMGVETRSALRSFQEKQGLPVDGLVGPATEEALQAVSGENPPTQSDGSTEDGDQPTAEIAYNGAATATAWTPENLTPVPGIENTSQTFRWKVIRIAEDLQVDPNFLMAIMSFESGFDPAIKNEQSGATGLIQFTTTTAKNLGTTTDALARMTAEQQLDYVAKYFASYKGRLKTLEDTYMAVLWPDGIGQDINYVIFRSPSIYYEQNLYLDVNKDGKTTIAEAISFVRKKLGSSAPGGAMPTGQPTLRRGSRGDAVKDLQSRLQRAGYDPGPIDGIFGSGTDTAVRSFQRAQSITVDGIVGPQTWGRLLGTTPGAPGSGVPSTAPPSTQVDTPLPASGTGFYSYTSADKRYGTLATIKAVQAIGAAWQAAHPGGPRIGVGNISKRGGGVFPPHSTHREGLNVDIRPVRNDNREEPVTYKDATYSRTLTQELVNLIYANPVLTVSSILFNDPGVQRVKPYPGHENHFHVTFGAPVGGGQPTTGYPTTGSALRTKIVQLALQERKRWKDGALTESDAAAKSILEDYWRTGVGLDPSTARAYAADATTKHWSAAFICWVIRRAGVTDKDFKYSSYHSTYIEDAYNNTQHGSAKLFKAYPTREVAPRVGDLVCNTYPIDDKGTRPPANLAEVKANTKGYHSNIVVSVTPGKLEVMGGNMGDTNKGTVGYAAPVSIDANGLIKDPKYFAVIRVG